MVTAYPTRCNQKASDGPAMLAPAIRTDCLVIIHPGPESTIQ